MRDDMTPQAIKKRALARCSEILDTREGSFCDTLIGPTAEEISSMDGEMDALFALAFVDEDSGGFLDVEGDKYGIYRKAGAKAACQIQLQGTPGAAIPEGTVFLTASELGFALDRSVLLDNTGAGTGHLTAEDVGSRYNVTAGAILRTYANVEGLASFSAGAAIGGADEESDKDYFGRIDAYRKRPPTSGNVHYYEQLALEVDGVGYAVVTPRENGPGTVGIMVASPDKKPVDSAVLSRLAQAIEDQQLICGGAFGYSVTATTISVAAEVISDGSETVETIQAALVSKLDTYLKAIPLSGAGRTISYHQIAYHLLSVPGVADYRTLTLCGGTANVSIASKHVPVLGTVGVTAV